MKATFPVTAHIFFLKENQILLLRRFNTGYEDGNYSVVAGHAELGESITQTAVREAQEEVGVAIHPSDLRMVGVMHRLSTDERIDFFLITRVWSGEIRNMELDKCDELLWCSPNKLPVNTISYIQQAIANFHAGIWYDEFGWASNEETSYC